MKLKALMSALVAAPLAFASMSANAHSVTVQNCGVDITFDKAPERLVVHDINMTEMALALGLQDKMVGVTGITGWYKASPEFFETLGDIPELAPKNPNLENILAADPDTFFAGWNYGMKTGGEVTPDILAGHDIKTLVLSESCARLSTENRPKASMDLLYDDVLRLGKVFHKEAEANALVDGWKAELADIIAKVGDKSGTRVFLYDSGDEKPFTAGKYAITTAMMEAAGGKNILDDWETSWGRNAWETVAARNPEFLILLDYVGDGSGAEGLMEFLKSHPAMGETDAVKNGRFVALRYEELTPGPANIDAIRKIAEAMNPGQF